MVDANENESIDRAEKQLKLAIVLCVVFMVCEVVGGLQANSLAILTDAGHLLSDLAGFLVSLVCLWLAKNRRATSTLSFGFKRAEVIGAVLSVSLIWLVTVQLVWEAVERTRRILDRDPTYEKVNGGLMFLLACLGLSCNLLMMRILGGHGHSHFGSGSTEEGGHGHSHDEVKQKEAVIKGYGAVEQQRTSPRSQPADAVLPLRFTSNVGDSDDEEEETHSHSHVHHHPHSHERSNLNVETAYIHALGDMLQSVGVLLAALAIWAFPESHYVELCDPAATFLFSVFVILTTVSILRTAINILLQGAPNGLDAFALKRALDGVPGVLFTYDLHVWSLSVGDDVLSVHVVVDDGLELDEHQVLRRINDVLRDKFSIKHSTCQIETQSYYNAVGKVGANPNCHAFVGGGNEGDEV